MMTGTTLALPDCRARAVRPVPPPEVVVLGPVPCQSCRQPVYWGHSFGWRPRSTGSVAPCWRDMADGWQHDCGTV